MVFKKLCVAAILAVASTPVLAAECSVDIAGNDQMQFDKKEITVSKSCKQFTVNLKHPGKLAKNVMGHNCADQDGRHAGRGERRHGRRPALRLRQEG